MPFDCIHLSAEETPPTAEDAIDDPKANRNEKGKEERARSLSLSCCLGTAEIPNLIVWEPRKVLIFL